MKHLVWLYSVLIMVAANCMEQSSKRLINEEEFEKIMQGVSQAWIAGDAARSVEFFHEQAVYEEPPRQQFYQGKQDIFNFFSAVMDDDVPLSMTWHNLAFNQQAQVGFGEYTFARLKQFHGIVVVQIADGEILKWREYQYQSAMDWEEFTGESGFRSVE